MAEVADVNLAMLLTKEHKEALNLSITKDSN
jgi:hypothetical protein